MDIEITDIVESREPQSRQLATLPKEWKEEWTRIFPTSSSILARYAPSSWADILLHERDFILSDRPTIGEWIGRYGLATISKWIEAQLVGLFNMSSQTDGGMSMVISPFARVFATQVVYYKVSEVYLFFAMYSTGRLDKSFSTFDTKRIGSSFFDVFVPHRNIIVGEYEDARIRAEKKAKEREDAERYGEMLKRKPEGMSVQEWTRWMVKEAMNGNEEAQRQLEFECKQPWQDIVEMYKQAKIFE